MKRDMDLIRSLLIGIESVPPSERAYFLPNMSSSIGHHLDLINAHGLIKLRHGPSRDDDSGQWYVLAELTWAGHDFVDTVRDDEIWRKTKEGAKAAGGFSFDLIKALAKGFMKKQIETRTGVELDL